ncbi:MAG: hypothetical protein IKO23_03940 [Bacteroidales bacterium]|nr:hypothetical protein [Bacteroidales bacterium]
MYTFFRRFATLVFGVFLIITGYSNDDSIRAIIGVVVLCWFIIDVLGDKYPLFDTIRTVYAIVMGAVILAFGVFLSIDYCSGFTIILAAMGVLIILNYLLPALSKRNQNDNKGDINSTLD